MKNIIKSIPLASSGLLLAVFSLGNLYNNLLINDITLFLGIILLLLLLLKLIFYRETVKNELNQLVILSTSGTFSMSLMLFSTFLIPVSYQLALVIWLIGIFLHLILIIIFSYRYVFNNFSIENVYGSYWIVFVGITMGSITGLSFNLQSITWIFFAFGFIMMLITLPLVTYRYIKYPLVPDQNKPLKCIYAAVLNILIVGYVNSFQNINIKFIVILYFIASIFYVYSLCKCLKYIKLPFYPSFSAFTFPFVISALASTKMLTILNNNIISYIVNFETIIATVLVIYVFYRYMKEYLL